MNAIGFDIVGFDLDGTLVDSSADLAAAVNHTLGTIGLPPHEVDEIKRFVGKGTRVMLERALKASGDYSDERLARLSRVLMDYYQDHLCDHTALYAGAMEAMESLRERGVRLAVCTNKYERFTLPILRELGIDGLFDAVISGDSVGRAKPHPEPLLAMTERAGGGPLRLSGRYVERHRRRAQCRPCEHRRQLRLRRCDARTWRGRDTAPVRRSGADAGGVGELNRPVPLAPFGEQMPCEPGGWHPQQVRADVKAETEQLRAIPAPRVPSQ